MDADIEAVLSDLDGIFTFKDGQKMSLKAFLGGKEIFASLPIGFG